MSSFSASLKEMKRIVNQRGGLALGIAKKKILQYDGRDAISDALRYFANITLKNALPVFPTLISLSCEAAGGSTNITPPFGAAIMMIAGAADVHDDIIDGSKVKGSNRTVFGKYGKEVTLLVGDVLLVEGLRLLQKECEFLSKEQTEEILQLVAETTFKIGRAEALDVQMKQKANVQPQDYLEIVRLKASVPELTMKIGAILANGKVETVQSLGQLGNAYGIVSLVAEEFMDLVEYLEFKNRIRNECPPLPVLYALQNEEQKNLILPLINGCRLNKKDFDEICRIVLKAPEVQKLKKEINCLVKDSSQMLNTYPAKKAGKEIATLFSVVARSYQLLENR